MESESGCHSQSHKRAYDLVNIENQGRKQSHKLDRIRARRIRRFPFLPVLFTTPSLMIQWKPWLLESEAEGEEPTNWQSQELNIVIGLFFHFCLRLWQCSFHFIVSDKVISKFSVLLPTLSVWFSLDYIARAKLLSLPPTIAPSLVKTTAAFKGQALSKLTSCENDFAQLVWPSRGKRVFFNLYNSSVEKVLHTFEV